MSSLSKKIRLGTPRSLSVLFAAACLSCPSSFGMSSPKSAKCSATIAASFRAFPADLFPHRLLRLLVTNHPLRYLETREMSWPSYKGRIIRRPSWCLDHSVTIVWGFPQWFTPSGLEPWLRPPPCMKKIGKQVNRKTLKARRGSWRQRGWRCQTRVEWTLKKMIFFIHKRICGIREGTYPRADIGRGAGKGKGGDGWKRVGSFRLSCKRKGSILALLPRKGRSWRIWYYTIT